MEMVYDFSYDGVMRSYERSLLALGLDTIDALLIHNPDPVNHGEHHSARMKDMAESSIQALEENKSTGDIKAVGMGLNATESLMTLASLVPLDFCIVAMPHTLLDQSSLETSMQRCIDNDISVVIGAPFASGILATGPIPGTRYRSDISDRRHCGEGAPDRGCVQWPRGVPADCCVAISTGPPCGRLGHPRHGTSHRS